MIDPSAPYSAQAAWLRLTHPGFRQTLAVLRPAALTGSWPCKVAEAVVAKVGAGKVGIRLSPYGVFLQDVLDDDGKELALYLVKELAKLKLLYLHMIEPR